MGSSEHRNQGLGGPHIINNCITKHFHTSLQLHALSIQWYFNVIFYIENIKLIPSHLYREWIKFLSKINKLTPLLGPILSSDLNFFLQVCPSPSRQYWQNSPVMHNRLGVICYVKSSLGGTLISLSKCGAFCQSEGRRTRGPWDLGEKDGQWKGTRA